MTATVSAHVRPQDTQDRGYIASLDGWRAIAVSLVIASHCEDMLINNGSKLALFLAKIVSHAGYGVDIFFALSGYLITTLLLREKKKNGKIDLSAFYTRRFFRILPPIIVYLCAVTSLSIMELIPQVTIIDIFASTFFFRNYMLGSWYTAHLWSLSIEEHFYAVVPVLVLVLRPRTLAITCILLAIACIGVRAYTLSLPASLGSVAHFRTENRVDALFWGSILAQICQHERWSDRLRDFLKPAVVIVMVAASAALLLVFDDQAFRRTLTAIVLPLVIVSTVLRPTDFAARVLELAPVRYIGRLSYSLYLWQMMFVGIPERTLGAVQDFPLALVVPLICAYLSYRFVEKPFIRLGHRILASRKSTSEVPQAQHR